MSNVNVQPGQVYVDAQPAVPTKRKLLVKTVSILGKEALVAITHDASGKKVKNPELRYIQLHRFNGRSRGYKLANAKRINGN